MHVHDPSKSEAENALAREQDRAKYSAWYNAGTYDPRYAGPYECVTLYGKTPDEARATKSHFRWFDGKRWSLPIESDLDQEFQRPSADHYPLDDAEYLPFAFRGLSEDPDPL